MSRRSGNGHANYHSLDSSHNDGVFADDDDDDSLKSQPLHATSKGDGELTPKHAFYLYLSHFLSMWNSRVYEFAAIVFIQHAFPGNLLATSINGIADTVCVLLFSSALGRWVDGAPSRLHTLLTTIVVNRVAVLVCCSMWFLVLTSSENASYKKYLFAIILGIGMVERSSRSANILSMERDWIPTIASSSREEDASYNLTYLNTMIRRIDVTCKFLAPLVISTFIAALAPVDVAVVVVAFSSLLSVWPECLCIQTVWKGNSQIQAPKESSSFEASNSSSSPALRQLHHRVLISTALTAIKASFCSQVNSLRFFFSTPVWVPALCAAVMHGSVLTWSGTLITYLLNAGFPLGIITVGKAIGTLFEVGSTFVFPRAVSFLSSDTSSSSARLPQTALHPRTEAEDALLETNEQMHGEDDGRSDGYAKKKKNLDAGVVRAGFWGISSMWPNLIPIIISLFYLDATLPPSDPPSQPALSPLKTNLLPIILLIAFLSLAHLGRWTYDLAATQLAQTLIPSSHRSSFGGTEMVMVSCFSLAHWVTAAVWHEQRQFKWLALASFGAISCAVGSYGWWARRWERRRRNGEDKEQDEEEESRDILD